MGIPSFRPPTNRIWGLVSLHVLRIFLEGFPSYRMSPWHPPTLRHLIEPTDTVAVEARTRCLSDLKIGPAVKSSISWWWSRRKSYRPSKSSKIIQFCPMSSYSFHQFPSKKTMARCRRRRKKGQEAFVEPELLASLVQERAALVDWAEAAWRSSRGMNWNTISIGKSST
jgi:hypothetical protein